MGEHEGKTWLIGTCPTTVVKIRQVEIERLVDTGSQVSILSARVVKRLGIDISIFPRLELKAANGLMVLNSGNVRVDIELRGKLIKGAGFVVSSNGRCLIGMNIISRYKGENEEGLYVVEINTIKVNIGCDIKTVREQLEDMVEAHNELFITKGEPLGWARVGEHHIRTVDTIPVAQPYRRIIPTEVESVKNQIDEWYQEGIIVKLNSEYASPLVVIKKGNNELRLCVDYRNLNKKTVRDA